MDLVSFLGRIFAVLLSTSCTVRSVTALSAPGGLTISPRPLGSEIVVPITRSHRVALVGDAIALVCSATSPGNPPPKYKWDFHPLYSVAPEPTWIEGASLTISKASKKDSGTYGCRAYNEVGLAAGVPYVVLEVLEPKLPALPSTIHTNLSVAGFELLCSVQGRPIAPITWRKDGNTIESGDFYQVTQKNFPDIHGRLVRATTKLLFRGKKRTNESLVELSDAGVYTCSVGNQSNYTTKLVVDGSQPPIVSVTAAEEDKQEGQDVTIECNVSALPAADTIQWVKEGDESFLVEGSVLTINNISVSSAGQYQCQAFNTIDQVEHNSTATFVLNVLHAPGQLQVRPVESGPVTLAIGDDFTLNCEAYPTGWPLPNYIWTKVSTNETVSSHSELRISGARKDEAGSYRCRAYNKMGSAPDVTVSIDVVEPTFVGLNESKEIQVGATGLELTCSLHGRSFQDRSAVWLRDGKPIQTGELYQIDTRDTGFPLITRKSILRFTGTKRVDGSVVTADDDGTYTCILENEAGSSNSTLKLIIDGTSLGAFVASVMTSSTSVILYASIGVGCVVSVLILLAFVVKKRKNTKGLNQYLRGDHAVNVDPPELHRQPVN